MRAGLARVTEALLQLVRLAVLDGAERQPRSWVASASTHGASAFDGRLLRSAARNCAASAPSSARWSHDMQR